MSYAASVHARAVTLVHHVVAMTTAAGSGHPTSAASLAHLVTVLLFDHLRHDPARPRHPASDRLVLSEGHAVPVIYAAAAELGIHVVPPGGRSRPLQHDDLPTLREAGSVLEGHPNPLAGFPFFDAATGSLGQGLSVAAGLALAARLQRRSRRVYCLIGDGESREGQVQEALDFIADHAISAVCPIFNCNGWGQANPVSPQQSPDRTTARLRLAGFEVRCIDGHDPLEIKAALSEHVRFASMGQPFAIVARTVKGWGAPSMQHRNLHGTAFTADERDRILGELDRTATRLGAAWTPGDLEIPPLPREPEPPEPGGQPLPPFREAVRRWCDPGVLERRAWAPRKAYGVALRALGHGDPRVVVLDADVSDSTFSRTFRRDPALEDRFVEGRIAEQNLVSVAAGVAMAGMIPFASTFGKFLSRAYDQVEMALLAGAPLKLAGTHVGVSLAADGPSQMALSDAAWFRATASVRDPEGHPSTWILTPADAVSAWALTLAAAAWPGACYLRLYRPDMPFIYDEATPFGLGGHHVVREGRDLVIVAWGYMVHEAACACEALARDGIEATLVDLYCLPFQAEPLVDRIRQHHGRVLTVEDNSPGGIGCAVAEALAAAAGTFHHRALTVRHFPRSGRTPTDVLRPLGLDADAIAAAARTLAG